MAKTKYEVMFMLTKNKSTHWMNVNRMNLELALQGQTGCSFNDAIWYVDTWINTTPSRKGASK